MSSTKPTTKSLQKESVKICWEVAQHHDNDDLFKCNPSDCIGSATTWTDCGYGEMYFLNRLADELAAEKMEFAHFVNWWNREGRFEYDLPATWTPWFDEDEAMKVFLNEWENWKRGK